MNVNALNLQTVEEAYQLIVNELKAFIGDHSWTEAGGHYRTLLGSVDASWWRKDGDELDERGEDVPREVNRAAFAAARFLRDDLLNTAGDRIWGFTFTLYPTGKFNIEYDYNQPESYTEEDKKSDMATEESTVNPAPLNLLSGLVNKGIDGYMGDPNEWSPESRELRQLIAAMSWLQTRTVADSAAWGLGSEANWNVDLNQGWVSWSFADGRQMQAQVQVVGTYNTQNGTFMWGWDHPSIPEPLRRAARHALALGEKEGFERLTTPVVSCTQDEAWQFTALASQLDSAAGAYRGNANGTWVYMAYGTPIRAA